IPGIGGGLCQVASTLYNAVLNASLEVVERTPHSRPVGYVPRGKDATVSTNIDFKFRNDTGNFILLRTSSAGNMINISILNNGDS
ncbi:MAG: VanW family protein, partial [Firmicutes bacterium]|nr:VanW family protein [Bacillota bacterium]